MSYLVSRIATAEPSETWFGDLVDVWQQLLGLLDAPQWEANWFARGRRRAGEPSRKKLRGAAARAFVANLSALDASLLWIHAPVASLQAELFASLPRADEGPLAILERGWPEVLESSRQPRCVTLAVRTDAVTDELAQAWKQATSRLFAACRGLFAEMATEPVLPLGAPYQPMLNSWTFATGARMKRRIVPAPWLILGRGHVDALGGEANARATLVDAGVTVDGHGLRVEVTDPLRPDERRLDYIRKALDSIALRPPEMPGLRYLLVTRESRAQADAATTLPIRTLADGTLEVDVHASYRLGARGPEIDEMERRVEASYASVPVAAYARTAASLSIFRAWGAVQWIRLGRKELRGGVPWIDLGGQSDGPTPITVLGAGPDTLKAAVAEWARLSDASASICGETIELDERFARGDSLLLLALAIDRAASADRRVLGVVFGEVVSSRELARQWIEGEPLMGAREPRD